MGGIPFRFGPLALTNTYSTNILNPGTTTGGVNCTSAPYAVLHVILYHIRVINKGAADATFRLFIGATGGTAAGTEMAYDKNVVVGSHVDLWFPSGLRLGTGDFLTGGASAATTLTIEGNGEIGVGA